MEYELSFWKFVGFLIFLIFFLIFNFILAVLTACESSQTRDCTQDHNSKSTKSSALSH